MKWTDDRDTSEKTEADRLSDPFWCDYCEAAIYSEDQYTHAHRHMDKAPTADAAMEAFERL